MEGRRGARVATTFLVGIVGLEEAPEPRQGDISATGVYFETAVDVGSAGTIHWLHLVSVDGTRELRVMAYVVRTAVMANIDGQQISGAAFEFMPESDDAVVALNDFVKYALALRHSGLDPHISARLDAKAMKAERPGAIQAARAAVVRKLSVRSLVLETSWAIAPGEPVRVDIVAPGMTRRIRLEGKAVRVNHTARRKDAPSYTIEVEVQQESDRPLRRHSSMSFERVRPEEAASAGRAAAGVDPDADDVTRMLDDLLSSLILPPEQDAHRTRVHHLSGQLSRISLPMLCSLFELERMTGELVVRHGIEEARVFIDAGQIVDVEPLLPAETGRARIRSVLSWKKEGSFEFYVQPVTRPNRIGASTTALLLDLAREEDEAAAASGLT